MSGDERKQFIFEEVAWFDWYDGIVRAVGSTKDGHYLLTMVAWDPSETRKRIYVATDLDAAVAEEMKRLYGWRDKDEAKLQEDWNRVEQLYKQSITNHGPVYCFAGEPKEGVMCSAVHVPAADLRPYKDYYMDETIQPSAQEFWFDVATQLK